MLAELISVSNIRSVSKNRGHAGAVKYYFSYCVKNNTNTGKANCTQVYSSLRRFLSLSPTAVQ